VARACSHGPSRSSTTLGVVDRVLEVGWSRDLRVRWYVRRELLVDLHLPGRDPLPDVPHPNLVLVPQWRTEQVLRERLTELGGTVEWSRELVDLAPSAGGSRTTSGTARSSAPTRSPPSCASTS
jgi:hypothetical protein